MGLLITTADLKTIDASLEQFKNTLGKATIKEIGRLLVVTLGADSRWVKVPQKEIGMYTEGRQPEGSFDALEFQTKTSKGDAVTYRVKNEKGTFWVELTSTERLIKGWHPDVVARVKAAGFEASQDLIGTLFNVGQEVISRHIKKARPKPTQPKPGQQRPLPRTSQNNGNKRVPAFEGLKHETYPK